MKKTFKKLNVIPYIEAWLTLGITEVVRVVSKDIMPTIGSSQNTRLSSWMVYISYR